MFKWNVEEMALLKEKEANDNTYVTSKHGYIYKCEKETSREDKIAFVDSMQDGKLSYILELMKKYEADRESLSKDSYGKVKTVSLKAWIKRNDTKYPRTIVDTSYRYGQIHLLYFSFFLQCGENIGHYNYTTYTNLVDELFHRQLKECCELEKKYFLDHDECSLLKREFCEYNHKYETSFGAKIWMCSDGRLLLRNNEDYERELTKEELIDLIGKYKQIDALVEKLTKETNIEF